jgi:hypothetical protein
MGSLSVASYDSQGYSEGILIRLHMGKSEIFLLYHIKEFSLYLTGITLRHSNLPPHGKE